MIVAMRKNCNYVARYNSHYFTVAELEKNPQLLLYASSDKAILDAIRNAQQKPKEKKKKK